MCNYCGSANEKYDYCRKCGMELCEDCANPITSRIFKDPRSKTHKAGHCWGFRYSQQLLVEIKKKADEAYQESKGTPNEELGHDIDQKVQKWKISDQKEMTQNVESLIFSLKAKIPNIEANKHIFEEIENIKRELDLVKQYQRIPILISLIPQTVQKVVGGNLIMGDVFENIQNATIINKSIVIDSFNKVKKEHDEDVAKALLQIGEFIEKSGEVSAGILYDKFNEELNKLQPEKSILKKIWEGIEKTLPTIVTISEVIAKIAPLF